MEKYSERFNDIVILQLDTEGFEGLSESQKKLTHYLAKAGLYGRFISVDQGSQYNVLLFDALIGLSEKVEPSHPLSKQVHDSLFILFAHNGVYHSMSGEKLTLPLEESVLESYQDELVEQVKSIWFSDKIKQFRTVQKDGVDVIQESGGNFYQNLTTQEVNTFRKENYPQIEGDQIPPFGFNERLVKNDGIISREIISENGLYGKYVTEIIKNLTAALEFTENYKQHESISTLIDFYRTGDAVDFDKHCVAWTQDRDSHVYFINGLIESYEDHC
jgi:Peptidase family M49